jgi:hypothetical protein
LKAGCISYQYLFAKELKDEDTPYYTFSMAFYVKEHLLVYLKICRDAFFHENTCFELMHLICPTY